MNVFPSLCRGCSRHFSSGSGKLAIERYTSKCHFKELRGSNLALITPHDELYHATERQLPSHFQHLPWWGFLWPGGHALTQFILADEYRKIFEGKSLFDFGCGCGVSGIAAVKARAKSVVACDIDPFAIDATMYNAALNGVHKYFSYTSKNVIGDVNSIDAEVVIAGDIFYDDRLAQAILPWFEQLSVAGKTVIFGDPGRWVLQRMGSEEREKRFETLANFDFPEEYGKLNNGIVGGFVYKMR